MTAFASELKDFPDLLRATAEWKGVPSDIVEKDYYLTRALYALGMGCGAQFLLKGGTSLSKGWNLLDRFSEDIDLLFRPNRPDGTVMGKTALDKVFKNAEAVIGKTKGFTREEHPFNSETGVHRTVTFSYARTTEAVSGLGNTIILEMGVRGGLQPTATRQIESFVGAFAKIRGIAGDAEDLAPFGLELLDIRRTFVEKLFAAYSVFETNRAAKHARHYYDLYCLCGLQEIQDFAGCKEYLDLRLEIRALSQEHFPKAPVPPEEGFRNCPAFSPSLEDLAALEKNYAIEQGLFLKLPPPTIKEILGRLTPLLDRL